MKLYETDKSGRIPSGPPAPARTSCMLVLANLISVATNIGALCFIWWLSHASEKTHNQMVETVEAQHATIEDLQRKLDESTADLRSEEAFAVTQAEKAVKAEQKAADLEAKLLNPPAKGKMP